MPPAAYPDRVVCGHVLDAPVHGSGYERVATAAGSDRTIRRRLKEWARWGIGAGLHALCLAALDEMIGRRLGDIGADGAITKAPCGGEKAAGPAPVDRREGARPRPLPLGHPPHHGPPQVSQLPAHL